MKILLTGAGGLVGTALRPALQAAGHEVVPWRRAELVETAAQGWTGLDAVIHLAGENIAARRWSPEQKQRIRASRVEGTAALRRSLLRLNPIPRCFLSASAVGWYGDRGDEVLTEESPSGTGFLAEVCRDWEAAAEPLVSAGVSVAHLRFGMILAPGGGALAKMLPIFRWGLGGAVGRGRQWMSWISLPDAIGAIQHMLSQRATGPFNIVAPNPVRNAEFSRTLARVLRRPCVLPVPAPFVRLAFGEMGEALLLGSQRVVPHRLGELAHPFKHPTLEQALADLLPP